LTAGFSSVRLETGDRQPEAIGLYLAWGYDRIPCRDEYADSPRSVCMAKQLRTEDGTRAATRSV
jgi:hypothetical protein